MSNRDFTAIVLLHNASFETLKSAREKLTKLGFTIVRSTEVEGKGYVTIACKKEQFEHVFTTKVEKAPAQGETGNFTPEHFKLTKPIQIPKHLKREVEEVFLPQPPTFL